MDENVRGELRARTSNWRHGWKLLLLSVHGQGAPWCVQSPSNRCPFCRRFRLCVLPAFVGSLVCLCSSSKLRLDAVEMEPRGSIKRLIPCRNGGSFQSTGTVLSCRPSPPSAFLRQDKRPAPSCTLIGSLSLRLLPARLVIGLWPLSIVNLDAAAHKPRPHRLKTAGQLMTKTYKSHRSATVEALL